jgi:hypothetical protein
MRRISRAGAGLGLVLLLGCGGADLSAPPSGALDLVLDTPASDDGIVLLEVSGGAVDSVTGTGYRVEASAEGRSPRRIVVSGALKAGTLARIWVPDRTRAADYRVSVVEVAARGTYLLREPGDYRVDVTSSAP